MHILANSRHPDHPSTITDAAVPHAAQRAPGVIAKTRGGSLCQSEGGPAQSSSTPALAFLDGHRDGSQS